jgi:hypothetical protein
MTHLFKTPSQDEPAVTSPELQRLVDAARDVPLPPLRVDADAVFRGYTTAKQGQRRVGAAAACLLAAGVAAFVLTRPAPAPAPSTGPSGQVAQHMAPGPDAPRTVVPRPPVLADPIHIVAEGDTPSPTVLGPWSVGLAPGSYAVEVEDHPGDDVLRARSAGGTVELHHGRVQILVGADHTEAQLVEGVATWVAPLGERRPLTKAEPVPSDTPAAPDASELARRAEAQLTAGKRDAAIKLLSQLVTQHAHHPAARSALIDLAGLLKGDGRTDEARCAYRLWLARYAHAQLEGDVQKALDRLGDGPACRGLRPR